MKGMIRYNDVKRLKGCRVNIVSSKNTKPHRLIPKSKRISDAVNILVVNEKEYAAAGDILGYQYVVRTEGDRGMSVFKYTPMSDTYYLPRLLAHVDGVKVDVFDVTGAGDTVTAVIAFCLDQFGFSEDNLVKACRCANREAAKVVTKTGTTVLDSDVDSVLGFFKSLDD
jgi:bifunctional ADP-heptose synthase (sugar kinase/adenylyltransferase)